MRKETLGRVVSSVVRHLSAVKRQGENTMLGKRMVFVVTLGTIFSVVLGVTVAVASGPDPNNFRVPLEGNFELTRIGGKYLNGNPIYSTCASHNGTFGSYFVDINVQEAGNNDEGTPVYASGDGTTTVGNNPEKGNYVRLQANAGVTFEYQHLAKVYVWSEKSVANGELVGLMGNTGNSTGAHLHWEAWVTSTHDPYVNIFAIPGVNVEEDFVSPCSYPEGDDGSVNGLPINPWGWCPTYSAQGFGGFTLFDNIECKGNYLQLETPNVGYRLYHSGHDNNARSIHIESGRSVYVAADAFSPESLGLCVTEDKWNLDDDTYTGSSTKVGWQGGDGSNMISWAMFFDNANCEINGEPIQQYLASNGTYVSVYIDSSGGTGGSSDITPPETQLSFSPPDGNNGWHVSPVSGVLSASDNEGVAHTYYQVNAGSTVEASSFSLTEDGIYDVCYWSVDVNGNVESAKCAQIFLDQTPPVTTGTATGPRDINGIFRDNVTATISATDNLSGVDFTQCSFDNKATWQTLIGATIAFNGNGVYQFFCRSQDIAGNVGESLDSGPIIINMYAVFNRSATTGFRMDRNTNITVNGDVYSEGSVVFTSNTTVSIPGTIEIVNGTLSKNSTNTNVNVGNVVLNAAHVDGISYPLAYYWQRCTSVYPNGLTLKDVSKQMNGIVCVTGTFTSYAVNVTGDVTFVVKGNIVFKPTCGWYKTNDPDNGMIMYATGSITLAGNCYDLLGLIYAPNGTITNQSTDTRIRGSIVANQVKFYKATGVTLTYDAAFAAGTFALPLDNPAFADPS